MNTVKLSDSHLRVINRALEVYYRMRSGQIGIALDTAYDECIDWDTRDIIEKMVRRLMQIAGPARQVLNIIKQSKESKP